MRLLSCLDRCALLGFDLWEFSLSSFFRRYGWVFLFRIVFKHPLRTFSGLLKYTRWRRGVRDHDEVLRLGASSEVGKGWLVGLGFCMKPLDCPSGRFNHDCALLSSGEAKEPCIGCRIGEVGMRALKCGADVYIMTSSEDVVYHMFVPMLKGRYRNVLLFLCPYTSKVMALPLLICGVGGMIVRYCSGYCKDYRDFLRADRGEKPEQTDISPSSEEMVERWLGG